MRSGDILSRLGDHRGALTQFAEVARLRADLRTRQPDVALSDKELASGYVRLARAYLKTDIRRPSPLRARPLI